MIKKLYLGFFVVGTCLFYSCVKDLHNSGISDATLMKGKVLEESEREPLAHVSVAVTNGSTAYASTKTNNEGRFELTVNYNNIDAWNYLFLDAGSSGITKRIELKGMGKESYDYGDIFLYNKNDGATPTISTNAVTNITSSSATCGGNITSDGGTEVSQRGLCWSTNENPNFSNSIISCGSGTGEFTGVITGLSPNTRYYVRAFATNAIGTAYGEQREFTTANGGGTKKPTVSTNPISNITSNSAECGGNVTSDGGATVTERGLCWAKVSVTNSPTLSNYSVHATEGGTGSYSCIMTGLSSNTTYYVRSYAKNSVGITYGDSIVFTTLSGGGNSAPTVTTGICSNVTSYTATCSGNVTSDGGSIVQTRGICWSTSPNPTLPYHPWGGTSVPNGTEWVATSGGTGTFSCDLTGLSPSTTYYYRAFAGNQVDVSYGEDRTFITLTNSTWPPEVYTYAVAYNSNNNTVNGKGFIISEGDSPVTGCGFCWGTTPDVEIGNNPNVVYSSGPNSSGIFTAAFSNLSPGTTYYVRAFATNGFGTGYGSPKQLVIPNGSNAYGQ